MGKRLCDVVDACYVLAFTLCLLSSACEIYERGECMVYTFYFTLYV